MRLQELLERGVITQETFDWFEPQWRKEEEENKIMMMDTGLENCGSPGRGGWSFLFGNNNNNGRSTDDVDDTDHDDDEGTMGSFKQVTIGREGDDGGGCGRITVDFYMDEFSAGHGNRVWHASVAMCLYLQQNAMWIVQSSPPNNVNNKDSSSCSGSSTIISDGKKKRTIQSSFRSIELGAGTALPSLYLANMLLVGARSRMTSSSSSTTRTTMDNVLIPSTAVKKPYFIHVTDGKQYRNIRQILFSVDRRLKNDGDDADDVVQFRVSPHNWGEGIGRGDNHAIGWADGGMRDEGGDHRHHHHHHHTDNNDSTSFLDVECCGDNVVGNDDDDDDDVNNDTTTMTTGNSYDLILISDCIYNPTHHEALLLSIRTLLKFPTPLSVQEDEIGKNVPSLGGRAIVSFSLHGNTTDQSVWDFVENKVGTVQCGNWRLHARPIPSLDIGNDVIIPRMDHTKDEIDDDEHVVVGWNMEEEMKRLNLWTANMESKRWIAYLYEITWTLVV